MKNSLFCIATLFNLMFLNAQVSESKLSDIGLNSQSVYLHQVQQSAQGSSEIFSSTSFSNSVMVNQIGNNNNIFSNTVSGLTSYKYAQIGNDNSIESYNTINNVSENILQQGNSNNVLNYSFGNVNNASLNLIQSGNNLSFEKFGTNSQTNTMSLRIIGDNRTVIVRSY